MSSSTKIFYSYGKLLLTGEYLVLKGAKALALPVNLGQKLEVSVTESKTIEWKTYEIDKMVFSATISLPHIKLVETSDKSKAHFIISILLAAKALSPIFLKNSNGISIKSTIEFNMAWGLGSSSTLINNIAQWTKTNAFKLNRIISKGSGYDIACAQNNRAIVYQLIKSKPIVNKVFFNPPFMDRLNLVYLNKKVATESNILRFISNDSIPKITLKNMNDLTTELLSCTQYEKFQKLIIDHELLIANLLNKIPIKQRLFSEFNGEIKSLGAWGGDFALVVSELPYKEQQSYFNSKGFYTFFPLNQLLDTKYATNH